MNTSMRLSLEKTCVVALPSVESEYKEPGGEQSGKDGKEPAPDFGYM